MNRLRHALVRSALLASSLGLVLLGSSVALADGESTPLLETPAAERIGTHEHSTAAEVLQSERPETPRATLQTNAPVSGAVLVDEAVQTLQNAPPAQCEMAPVRFNYGQSSLDDGARARLDAAASCLIRNPSVRLWLTGHASHPGTDALNWSLAMDRAQTIKRYLIHCGVDPKRLLAFSAGEAMDAERHVVIDVSDRRSFARVQGITEVQLGSVASGRTSR